VIDHLLEAAFPGVSGFRHDRRPPHRVEGGAALPLTPQEEALLHSPEPPAIGEEGPWLKHCRFFTRALIAALRDLKELRPEEVQGLL
jgi:hypothetical protein